MCELISNRVILISELEVLQKVGHGRAEEKKTRAAVGPEGLLVCSRANFLRSARCPTFLAMIRTFSLPANNPKRDKRHIPSIIKRSQSRQAVVCKELNIVPVHLGEFPSHL